MGLDTTIQDIIEEYQEELREVEAEIRLDQLREATSDGEDQVSARLLANRKRVEDLNMWIDQTRRTK
jgi:hypothetical protein